MVSSTGITMGRPHGGRFTSLSLSLFSAGSLPRMTATSKEARKKRADATAAWMRRCRDGAGKDCNFF